MYTEFPVTDEAIKALKIKVLRDLSNSMYPRESIGNIASNHGITFDDAKALVERHGWPDRGAMGRAADVLEGKRQPEPAGPKPGPKPKPPQVIEKRDVLTVTPGPPPAWVPPATGTEQLLQSGEKSSKARTRRLAEKVRTDLRELSGLVIAERKEAEAAKAKAEQEARLRQEIAEFEQQIAERKKLLRPPKPYEAVAKPAPPKADNKKVRAWAWANGVDCPRYGIVPIDVVMQYQRAMEGKA